MSLSSSAGVSDKKIYFFGNGVADGNKDMRDTLGGKGANLAQMSLFGIPVPPGFTIAVSQCSQYYESLDGNSRKGLGVLPNGLREEVIASVKKVQEMVGSGAEFGSIDNPLLLSVRSGAAISMPGMMDTILNLGLNDETVEGLAKISGDARFAHDSYRRFIQMYSDVVLGVEHSSFENIMDDMKLARGVRSDADLTANEMKNIVQLFKDLVKSKVGCDFHQDVNEQLVGAILAVFTSWESDRAKYYRNMNNIRHLAGTAVNIQAMVFGNLGEESATGVAFTRNPSTGENKIYGEYLINAQGEDVVSGIRTPYPLSKGESGVDEMSLEEKMPNTYKEFLQIARLLEERYQDMQDIEFTVQKGKLWILQTRSGKRTVASAVKIAVDLVREGLVSKEEALMMIDPALLDSLLHRAIEKPDDLTPVVKGLPASPGAATGAIAFSCNSAVAMVKRGERVILVRTETSPEDIEGMAISEGIFTTRGGMTSHAAVVARGMGKACITGAHGAAVEAGKLEIPSKGTVFKEGDVVTIDGGSGFLYIGDVPKKDPELSAEFGELMQWADDARTMRVRANAETEADASMAMKFGAEGIGLCRTEHMFFNKDRIALVRGMILSEDAERRKKFIEQLMPHQIGDFERLFKVMDGLPVNIRLLDPPLHEFLPNQEEDKENIVSEFGFSRAWLQSRIESLTEVNPMLGRRGCRLGICETDIYEAQIRAIFEAALNVTEETGKAPVIEIMIPLVMDKAELDIIKCRIEAIRDDLLKRGGKVQVTIGTMIELPRAALRAGDIAKSADYFSFGTNDLTQTTLGISRDDSSSFWSTYINKGVFGFDPFSTIDKDGVGELVRTAIERGRAQKIGLKTGVCGEHGGDPKSIEFFAEIGMDYVSCSPYRIPVAKFSAALYEIKKRVNK